MCYGYHGEMYDVLWLPWRNVRCAVVTMEKCEGKLIILRHKSLDDLQIQCTCNKQGQMYSTHRNRDQRTDQSKP
jgi:hypothetical protein